MLLLRVYPANIQLAMTLAFLVGVLRLPLLHPQNHGTCLGNQGEWALLLLACRKSSKAAGTALQPICHPPTFPRRPRQLGATHLLYNWRNWVETESWAFPQCPAAVMVVRRHWQSGKYFGIAESHLPWFQSLVPLWLGCVG